MAICLTASCSASEPAENSAAATAAPDPSTVEASPDADNDADTTSDEQQSDDVATVEPAATVELQLSLQDETDIATVTDLDPGEQIEDAQGNLLAIYGVAAWPHAFDDLVPAAREQLSFFGDVASISEPDAELLVLDVGMCTAGIDSTGFGTAEFFVHASASELLSTDAVLDRAVLARHPVVQPSFTFPGPAECSRGFLPVLWSGEDTPAVARYVLATRTTAAAPIERHVYQWELRERPAPNLGSADGGVDQADQLGTNSFGVGQTVTFNEGALASSTFVVDGWAELIGTESAIAGTRLVAVSLTFCLESSTLPAFGLGVDGWNIVAPIQADLLGAALAEDPSEGCFDGWLEFAIPNGAVPTSFFASDGTDAVTGYAEWSLVGAALATPES